MKPSRAFQILGRLGPEIGGIVGVFSLKAMTTGLSFALVLLAARGMGADEFGTYSILFSIAGLLSVAATFGQHIVLMRAWSEYCAADRPDLLKGSLIFSGMLLGAGTAVATVPFLVWCAGAYDWETSATVAAYLATLSIMMATTHLVRSAVGVRAGDGWSYVLPLAPAVAYLVICLADGEPASAQALFAIMTAGAIAAITVHAFIIRRALIHRFPAIAATSATFDLPAWGARSIKLWISSGLEAANQFVDVIIVGLLLSPVAAGVYFVLTRLANIISVGADAIHMYTTRHIPALYYGREFSRLNGMLDAAAWATLAVAIIGVGGVALGGHLLLAAFNAEYASYHAALLMLACGVAAAVSAGPSGSILMLTGHEGRYLSIMTGTVVSRIVAMFVLVPLFGARGAATAATASLVVMALLLLVSGRALAGIDGSVLRLLPRSLLRDGTPEPVSNAAYAEVANRPHISK